MTTPRADAVPSEQDRIKRLHEWAHQALLRQPGSSIIERTVAEDLQYLEAKYQRDLAAAQEELERVRDKCNEHYMALAAAQEALAEREEAMHLRIRADYDKAVADAWKAELAKEQEARQRAEELLKQFFLNDSPWPDVESREEMQSFIDNMTTEERGLWGQFASKCWSRTSERLRLDEKTT